MANYVLAIHGGAGTISQQELTPEREQAYRDHLAAALTAGQRLLEAGGTALDAVEAAVCALEDSPLFNAGRGAVYTQSERHEMEASIMCGKTQDAGATALIRQVRNPIRLARCVMDQSEYVLLTGEGAEAFAAAQGLERVDPAWFGTESRLQQLHRARARATMQLDHSASEKMGTVGAVALDQAGNLAAATSTGGMTNKPDGRLGDSAIIGAGTYARNGNCAVSCTGHGEYFIRGMVAHDVACMMAYGGLSLLEASEEVIFRKQVALGGSGGLIAVDAAGHLALPYNSGGMYRGWVRQGQAAHTAIFGS